ncbi:MAG TPA: hypothetical protein VM555_10700 [Tahibacter sp.]|nr:hypothetical protein [Tahibacter sp.]
MRGIFLAALCAAFAAGSAHAANWSKFVGSNPNFPNRLADHGLAIDDDSGYVAVDAYNRLNGSGQIEFVHQYTIDDTGTIPWIWGLVGKNGSHAIVPHGAQLRQGFRTTWIERQVPPDDIGNPATDEIGFAAQNASQPTYWHVEPRTNGKVVQFSSIGWQGTALLRTLDAGAGYEVVSLDAGGWPRWRSTAQPCDAGVDPSNLVLDYAASIPGSWQPLISVAGTCANLSGTHVFAQRFDHDTGSSGMPEWIVPPPDRTLLRYAFSPAHELIAAYDTPWQMQEIWRIGVPGAPYTAPSAPLFGLASIEDFAPTAGNDLVIAGREYGSGEQAIVPIYPVPGPFPITAVGGLAAFGPGDWQFALDDEGRILALRKETVGAATQVRLVGLDSYGQTVDWTQTIDNVLADAQPQVAVPRDNAHGFIVAVDTQDASGTIGVQVMRVGSPP